ncbi:MAG TPA: tetratricopeptide repeat protein [Pyrinomonadaceae bacterium]|jgi:tetratricopeptide (TPR) repeat protein
MSRNISFCVVGILVGFMLGFFVANAGLTERQPAETPRTTTAATTSAPPLNPQQQVGPLPPGHPSVDDSANRANSSNGDRSGGASTSPLLQAAMDEADRNPRDFAAQMKAADAFYNMEAYDKAVVYLNRALALKPNDADALTLMGNAKYDQNDFVTAATFYERSLAQRPDANVRTDLGNTFFQRTPPDYDRAIAAYRKALAIEPRNEKALRNLAAAALFKGDKKTAREAIDRLTAVNPDNPALASLRSGLEQ